jgi:hypothetical protein
MNEDSKYQRPLPEGVSIEIVSTAMTAPCSKCANNQWARTISAMGFCDRCGGTNMERVWDASIRLQVDSHFEFTAESAETIAEALTQAAHQLKTLFETGIPR